MQTIERTNSEPDTHCWNMIDQKDYIYGEEITGLCSESTTTVSSEKSCQDAAIALGGTFVEAGHWPVQFGCVADLKDGGEFWFNENVDADARPHRRSVCERESFLWLPTSDYCPEGFHVVTDLKTCEKLSLSILNLNFGGIVSNPNLRKGCFHDITTTTVQFNIISSSIDFSNVIQYFCIPKEDMNATEGSIPSYSSTQYTSRQLWRTLTSDNDLDFRIHQTDHNGTRSFEYLPMWERLNPHHFIQTWTDNDVRLLFSSVDSRFTSVYNHIARVEKADVFRYLVTYDLGGVYVDADTYPKQPVDEWSKIYGYAKDVYDFALGIEFLNGRYSSCMQLNQFVFISRKNNPIMKLVIDEVFHAVHTIDYPDCSKRSENCTVEQRTGPQVFSNAIWRFIATYLPTDENLCPTTLKTKAQLEKEGQLLEVTTSEGPVRILFFPPRAHAARHDQKYPKFYWLTHHEKRGSWKGWNKNEESYNSSSIDAPFLKNGTGTLKRLSPHRFVKNSTKHHRTELLPFLKKGSAKFSVKS